MSDDAPVSHWHRAGAAIRLESLYGDRVEPCFVERPRSLHQMLEHAAARDPDRCALVCGDERLSYGQLLEAVGQLAAGMAAVGVQAGDRVAIWLGNRIEFVVTLFAATRLGAIAVPLSTREQTPGLAYMLQHCGAMLLVHEAHLADVLPPPAQVPALRHRWQVGDGALAASSRAYADQWRAGQQAPVTEVHEQDTAVILYTSGTTGRPKGAMLTHLGIVHSSMHFALAMDLGPQDATVAAVPLSHVTGLVALTTTFVYCAGKMVIMPAFKAADYLRIAGSEDITHSLMVPAMYKLCLLEPGFTRYDLSRWRIGAYGGAPMPVATIVELAEKVPELVLMNCYGATETTSPATVMPPGQTRAHNDTVGQSLHCVDMRVMDDEGREQPPGTLGEIWIKGPMVVRGYWDNPQATQEHITGGYWHSGDLGTIDAQGYVRVMDRKKDMINRGGFKIYTIEVENALYEHAGVQECAVVAKPCPVLGERVHAFVSLKPGHAARAELPGELKAHCAARLSDYKVPESYTVLTTPLPRNANGKLLKREMREQVLSLSPCSGDAHMNPSHAGRAGSFAQSVDEVRSKVGRETFLTDWVQITQRHIDLFAEATGDFQWIHVDVARARGQSPYGSTIAHGFLTLSLLGQFYERHLSLPFCEMGLNYGLNKVRFTSPVPADSRVRGRFVLADLQDIAGGLQLTFRVTLEVEGQERPACVAESVVRQYFQAQVPPKPPAHS